jgi:hypothetical protein
MDDIGGFSSDIADHISDPPDRIIRPEFEPASGAPNSSPVSPGYVSPTTGRKKNIHVS